MTVVPNLRMTVDEFLAWAIEQPGRYELAEGVVHAMAPETTGHAEMKAAVHAAFLAGVRARRLPCYVLPDGVTVRIDDWTAYEPEALVYRGTKLPASAMEVPEPVVLVEVLSPSTRGVDVGVKVAGYFRLPSVAHYLIIDPIQPLIIHHERGSGDPILTRIVSEGVIGLDPPGIELNLTDIYLGGASVSARSAPAFEPGMRERTPAVHLFVQVPNAESV